MSARLDHLAAGVDHAAFPTFDPAGTYRFYHEVLGMPVAHAICAVGWGPDDHPDFVHFFFDIGNGDRIAFFYYFGLEPFGEGNDVYACLGEAIPRYFKDSRHLAIHVESEEALNEYQRRLESSEFGCEMRVKHETIESIYTHDPNGYFVEFAVSTRELGEEDDADAELTLRALLDVVADDAPSMSKLWARKAELIIAQAAGETVAGVVR